MSIYVCWYHSFDVDVNITGSTFHLNESCGEDSDIDDESNPSSDGSDTDTDDDPDLWVQSYCLLLTFSSSYV